ncbi:TIGR04222 domain-containing membrane protein [Kitasatospora purpeofusca]|uniref:TIGR04222 domain-containing membrane protein n=1 Tax=Kitasatospora purpeofusca TaxID=67352 RepID=A0ABZ1UAZ2_9ACTN|nr:TIGR04222 domain-containing membrane protein [Kitasatospora purpeofusca]
MRGPRDRTAGRGPSNGEELTLHELALLAGGAWRVAETALARMLLDARVEIDRHGMIRVVRPRPRDEVEAVLLAALGPSGTGWLGAPRAAFGTSAPACRLEEDLRGRGLIVGGTTGPDRGRPLLLPTRLAVPLLILLAVGTARGAAAAGAGPGPALLLAALLPLLVAFVLSRFGTPPDLVVPYWRPAARVEPLLAALRTGAPLPPGWRLSPDALAPAGRTTWAAVAAAGVRTLGRHHLTTAFHGAGPRPPRPRRSTAAPRPGAS